MFSGMGIRSWLGGRAVSRQSDLRLSESAISALQYPIKIAEFLIPATNHLWLNRLEHLDNNQLTYPLQSHIGRIRNRTRRRLDHPPRLRVSAVNVFKYNNRRGAETQSTSSCSEHLPCKFPQQVIERIGRIRVHQVTGAGDQE